MKIKYGLIVDITDICYDKLKSEKFISIPVDDCVRANCFGDPIPNVQKKIYIEKDDGSILEIKHDTAININVDDKTITTTEDLNEKIKNVHNSLTLLFGNFNDELPEQKLALKYLKGDEKVLEIGGNIGRNTLIISHILGENSHNLVTLETDSYSCHKLLQNKIINKKNFHIENSALSKRRLIQKIDNWTTIEFESDVLPDGYKEVNTITLHKLRSKYNIIFDTLILDCEGAFYYILMDMPEILDGIKLIIMENDYNDINHKNFVDEMLKKNNFYLEYVESGGWGPCFKNFYEVWKRK
jgi:FkbM family methyltransferase